MALEGSPKSAKNVAMPPAPSFDLAAAHRWFATDCFNRVWELLDKPDRSSDDDERMISLCHASLAHGRERSDCAPLSLSIGYWQLSRVYAVLGLAEGAGRYGNLCLGTSAGLPPFYLAYAHEALARTAKLTGDTEALARHRAEAGRLALEVADAGECQALEADLTSLDT